MLKKSKIHELFFIKNSNLDCKLHQTSNKNFFKTYPSVL